MSAFEQPMGGASLALRGVGKSFGAARVLEDISLDVEDGEFVALVGPSGCGKSTLLRIIAGLEEATTGEISLGGRVINDIDPKDRDMAMVFQNYALYPHLSVRKNMGFSLSLRGMPAAEIDAKVREAARILDLESLLDRRPAQLSGGQRQRVAMGRAIVRQPRVFLFDEPLSNLDAKLRVKMRSEIKHIHQRFRATTIYVTHDQIEAMSMSDKVVVMRSGVIEQIGKPLDLFDRPRNLFVAQFIGSPSMAVLSGRMTANGFAVDGGGVADTAHQDQRTASIGIRPDKIRLAASETGIEMTTEIVEPGGSETYLAGKVGSQDFSALLPNRMDVAVGEIVRLVLDADHLHYFDKAGNRL